MSDKKIKILFIDDDPVNSKVLSRSLESRGYDLVTVLDERTYQKFINDLELDIVLLDLVMPHRSGMEILEEIRESFSSSELPIIMQTASEDSENVIESLKKGANDYITKPVDLDVLEARIKTQYSLKKYYKESIQKAQYETVAAMITTYNHEINNPLAIALSGIEVMQLTGKDKLDLVKNALFRIRDIVVKIEKANDNPLSFEQYVQTSSMLKLEEN